MSYSGSTTYLRLPHATLGHHIEIAHRTTERVEIDHLEGRITVGLVTPYPPGIPLLIPGEVFNKKIVDYLKFSREFSLLCPGCETDIHGLVEVEDDNGDVRYFADCVAEDGGKRKVSPKTDIQDMIETRKKTPYARSQ